MEVVKSLEARGTLANWNYITITVQAIIKKKKKLKELLLSSSALFLLAVHSKQHTAFVVFVCVKQGNIVRSYTNSLI